ncbi:MAG: hypothetical protein ACN4GW_14665 [Desulforhopalus sp.]
MVYNYLLGLYKVLETRNEEIKTAQAQGAISPEQNEYLLGRQTAVSDFSRFLHQNYHEKLPRRLQK